MIEHETKPTRKPKTVPPPIIDAENGGFQPQMPTCGLDLMAIWGDVPSEAHTQVKLKIGRPIPGTRQTALVAESTIQEYDLSQIAAQYGQGEYVISLPPGRHNAWPRKQARVMVSREYARDCGFESNLQPVAPTRVSEMRSLRESSDQLSQGKPFTMEAMAQLIETVIERTAERLAPRQVQPAPAQAIDPVQQLMTTFAFLQQIEDRSFTKMAKLMELKGVPGEQDENSGIMGMVKENLPGIIEVAKGIFAPKVNYAQQEQSQQLQSDVIAEQQITQIQPTPQESQMNGAPSPLTPQETTEIADVINTLRPFAGIIANGIAKSPTIEKAADEIIDWIPPRIYNGIKKLAEYVDKYGFTALNSVDASLGNEKCGKIIKIIRDILIKEVEND